MSVRIIFFGTPDFAVASLSKLLDGDVNILAVVTAPDKPAGRGMLVSQSPVKKFAEQHNLQVLQPPKLKDEKFIETLRQMAPDLMIVVAFRMLPEVVWNLPPLGTVNLHASLLPRYRGAAPINWAIINGETLSGVTTFKIQHAIDTGNILLSEKMSIGKEETSGELLERMKERGADLLIKTIRQIEESSIKEIPQDEIIDQGTLNLHAPRIYSETCKIDWRRPVQEVYNLIRGLSPLPGAFTFFHKKKLKIFRSHMEVTNHIISPGDQVTDHKSFLKFATPDGFIDVKELQLEGKKKMVIEEFLKGWRG